MAFGRWTGRIVIGLILFAFAGSAWAGVMSKAEFRMELRDAIVRLAPKAKVKMVDEDTLRVVPPGSKPKDGSSIFVGNAYDRYLNDPDALETIVGQMARMALEDDKFAAVTQDNLIVLIRPIDYVTQPGFEKIKFLTRPFAGDFIQIIAVDGAETFQMVAADQITPVFPSEAAAWAQAEANTRMKMGRMEINTLEPGVWTITNESSLALNFVNQPDTWKLHGVTMTGDPVAVFSQRNLLLLADGGDKDRLKRVATFVDQLAGDPEIISTTLFTRHDGVWSVLERKP
jgi:hypothetical protein